MASSAETDKAGSNFACNNDTLVYIVAPKWRKESPIVRGHTRAKIRRSIRNLDHSMKADPVMFATPQSAIIPVYEPWSALRIAPAAGPPARARAARGPRRREPRATC